MKKVTLMLFVTLMFMITTKARCSESLPSDGIKIVLSFEIGIPFICTPAWSICKVSLKGNALTGTAELMETADVIGTGQNPGGGTKSVMLSIPRDIFAKYYPGYLSKLDGKNTVTFDATYTFPPDVKKALGAPVDIVVQGNVAYLLKYENGVFNIFIPL